MTAPSLLERPTGLLVAVRPADLAPPDAPLAGSHRASGRRAEGRRVEGHRAEGHGVEGRRAGGRRAGGRRPGLLLVAALLGGIAAAGVSLQSAPSAAAGPVSVIAAEQALGTEQGTEVQPLAQITLSEARARLEEVRVSRAKRDAAAQEATRPKAVLPIQGAYISSCFCARWGTFHWGIDFAAPMDTPEYAAMDGVVIRAGAASGFGLAVYILHENGDVTVYGHMDKILVSAGQVVQAGQTIALLGARGQATGPHLHFEVHQGGMDGTRIDPLPWLRARGVAV